MSRKIDSSALQKSQNGYCENDLPSSITDVDDNIINRDEWSKIMNWVMENDYIWSILNMNLILKEL